MRGCGCVCWTNRRLLRYGEVKAAATMVVVVAATMVVAVAVVVVARARELMG